MRRRVKDNGEGYMPARLRVYTAADWQGVGCHPECAFWEAVGEWREAHSEGLEGPGAIVLIDGPDVPWHEDWG